jgi:hypothetical protein
LLSVETLNQGQDAALLGARQVFYVEERSFSVRGGERAVNSGCVQVDLDAKTFDRVHRRRPLEKFLHCKVKTAEIQQDDGKDD